MAETHSSPSSGVHESNTCSRNVLQAESAGINTANLVVSHRHSEHAVCESVRWGQPVSCNMMHCCKQDSRMQLAHHKAMTPRVSSHQQLHELERGICSCCKVSLIDQQSAKTTAPFDLMGACRAIQKQCSFEDPVFWAISSCHKITA